MGRGTGAYELLNDIERRLLVLERHESMGQDVTFPIYRFFDLYHAGGLVSAGSGGVGTVTVDADQLYFLPFPVPERQVFTAMGLRVTAGAGNARLGIYVDGGGYPSDLVFDYGEVSTAAIGVQTITYTVTLYKGLYWLAVMFSATPTVAGLVSEFLWSIGLAADLATVYVALTALQAYGPMPTTIVPASLVPVAGDVQTAQPLLVLRKQL